jgi:hypothetical protein
MLAAFAAHVQPILPDVARIERRRFRPPEPAAVEQREQASIAAPERPCISGRMVKQSRSLVASECPAAELAGQPDVLDVRRVHVGIRRHLPESPRGLEHAPPGC